MKVTAAVMPERSGRWALETLELADPGPHEVVVRTVASGICQTDVHARDGYFPLEWPAVYGHEGAGVVERVGSAVSGVAPGDHVIMANPSCGECPNCRQGLETYCYNSQRIKQSGRRLDGSSALTRGATPIAASFFQQSSFATHSLASERNVIKVPADAPLDVLAAFPCGVNTGAGAVFNILRPQPGDAFAVFGVGSVGMAGLMAAKLRGCDPVIAVDVFDGRLALARELGATHAVSAAGGDAAAEVRRIAAGRGVKFSLEAAGTPEALRAAVDALAPLGTCCLVGSARPGVTAALEMRTIQYGRAVRGCIQGDSDVKTFLPHLVELFRSGRLPVDRLVRHYDFAAINEAVADMLAGRTIKPVLRIGTA
ncbi:MAG: NAD(P)-dependent alcohol dehydrogenase [Burkholderiales bacterium]|nr:NAD(P)-dependent alcohol dehydrogenase [Burkholderiales bacterium]